MRVSIVAYMVVTTLLATTASSETYKWVDEKGVVHFTDDPVRVPQRFLNRIELLPSTDPDRSTPTVQMESPQPESPSESKPAVTNKTYGGHDEAWWRTNFRDLHRDINKLQSELPAKREERAALHRKYVISLGRTPKQGETAPDRFFRQPPAKDTDKKNTIIPDPADQSRTTEPSSLYRNRAAYHDKMTEINSDEARLKSLEEKLQQLTIEADRAGVPTEWRQP